MKMYACYFFKLSIGQLAIQNHSPEVSSYR